MKVKICGVTRVQDARAAWEAGADAVGLNFWEGSVRRVEWSVARAVAREREPFGAVVGVFVNERRERVRELVRELGLSAVQFHGDEGPEACVGYDVPVIKALRVRGPEDVARGLAYDVAGLLLDGDGKGYGGGGVSFPWALARGVSGRRVLVAGGLGPWNVAEAVRVARPWGVDVASGVERAPGVKDEGMLRAFVRAARWGERSLDEEVEG